MVAEVDVAGHGRTDPGAEHVGEVDASPGRGDDPGMAYPRLIGCLVGAVLGAITSSLILIALTSGTIVADGRQHVHGALVIIGYAAAAGFLLGMYASKPRKQ